MRRMIRRCVGLLALVAVLACGRTRKNHDQPGSDASGASSTLQGGGSGGTSGMVATASNTGGSSATAGSSGGVGGTVDTAGVGGTALQSSSSGGTGSNNSVGGSAGAAGDQGIGGTSGTPDPSCQVFVRVFEEESCLECRMMADATCDIYFRQTEETCPASFACFRRHCAFNCADGCEEDSCACLESCLPAGPSDCRNAFDTLTDCYAGLCGDC